jgi:hypothetical protein
METSRTLSECEAPSQEEQDSYYTQSHAGDMLIDAMMRIGQTYARSSTYGLNGSHELVVIRTDHVGAVRRLLVGGLMWVIGLLARAEPGARANVHCDEERQTL